MAGDHSLWPPNSHNVNPGLIFVQGVQHDLQEIKEQGVRVRPTLKQPNKYCNCSRRKLDPGSKQSSAGVGGRGVPVVCFAEHWGSQHFLHLPAAGLEVECKMLYIHH